MTGCDPPADPSFLSGTPVFAALSDPALALIAEHLQRRVLPAGSLVVREGESAREMFVVEKGEVEVLVHGEEELALATLHEGDCFGEMSLLDVQPRSASVRTRTATTLLVLHYGELLAIRERDGETFTLLVMNVAREVSRRLRVCEHLLLDKLRNSGERGDEAQQVFGRRRPEGRGPSLT